uniref:WD_REPEATS_REGION domain-containing protein n=1 Tax=Syphacia muris TaxID=451379 RepID=A0A0N5ABX9_9BILA
MTDCFPEGDFTKEIAIFMDHDWFSVIGSATDTISVVANLEESGTKEVGQILTRNGRIISDCNTDWDDSIPNPYPDMHIKKLEKHQICIGYGGYETTFVGPMVSFNEVHDSTILSCDVNSTGSLVVSSACDGSVKVWNSQYGGLIKKFDFNGNIDVNKVRFFPSGLVVLACGDDMSVRVFSVETGLCHRTFLGHIRSVNDVGFIGVGREVLSIASDGTVKMWSVGSSECLHTFHINQRRLYALDVCRITNTESVLCGIAGEDGGSILDLRCGEIIPFLYTRTDKFMAVAFDNEHNVYLGSERGAIFNYDIRNRKAVGIFQTLRSDIMHFSKITNDMLFTSFRDGSVCAYEKSLKHRPPIMCFSGSDCDPVFDFSIYNDSYLYACCRDRAVRKYEIPLKSWEPKPIADYPSVAEDLFLFHSCITVERFRFGELSKADSKHTAVHEFSAVCQSLGFLCAQILVTVQLRSHFYFLFLHQIVPALASRVFCALRVVYNCLSYESFILCTCVIRDSRHYQFKHYADLDDITLGPAAYHYLIA